MIDILKGEIQTQSDRERMPCDNRGRDWNDDTTNQGIPTTTQNKKTQEQILFQSLRMKYCPITPLFWASSLQNCDTIYFCCFKLPSFLRFGTEALENKYKWHCCKRRCQGTCLNDSITYIFLQFYHLKMHTQKTPKYYQSAMIYEQTSTIQCADSHLLEIESNHLQVSILCLQSTLYLRRPH